MQYTDNKAQTGDTPERLVATAEMLFSERGADSVSVRELTAAAGVSLGSVNYYFGSKDKLIEAVYETLCNRIVSLRLNELEQYLDMQRALDEKPALLTILESFIKPFLEPCTAKSASLLLRLMLEHRLKPSILTARLFEKFLDPLAKQYIAAIGNACPNLSQEELVWFYSFMVNSVAFTMTDMGEDNRIRKLSAGLADNRDFATLEKFLLKYIVAGFSQSSEVS